MQKVGIADLPLHGGNVPPWLFKKMVKLAKGIIEVIIYEYGEDEFLKRISNPFWFQSFSCVLGFDWHSSGTTTVTCGALKLALNPKEHKIAICGGKGKGKKTLQEIENISNIFELNAGQFKYLSRITAKVDSVAIQDFHSLYHHCFFLTENKKWAVIQQGLNGEMQTARRYHWISDEVSNLIDYDKTILGIKQENVLNMTAKESEEARKISLDLINDGEKKFENAVKRLPKLNQRSLLEFSQNTKKIETNELKEVKIIPSKEILNLQMPKRIDWTAVKKAYDFQPKNYEELLSIEGIGKATVRALALISELIYGKRASWNDPVKFTFTVGGKDGVPYPVDRKSYDETIEILKEGIERAKVGDKEKLNAVKRLRKVISKN